MKIFKTSILLFALMILLSSCSLRSETADITVPTNKSTVAGTTVLNNNTTSVEYEIELTGTTVRDTTTEQATTAVEATTDTAKESTTSSDKQKSETTSKSKIQTTSSVTKAAVKETTTKQSAKNSTITTKNGLTYVDGILIANKTYSLPESYAPGVNQTAMNAFNEMKSAASKEGVSLWIVSDYRSYSTQKSIYNGYVSKEGKAAADRYSARPGHSEHQTGLAFDVNSLSQSFENTAEGKWLAKNCWKYGFIIRYPKDKESVTGYMYEPWHIRYLGKDTAKKVYDSGLSLEEYLGITSRYS